jgi:1-aminocyclopropane-1-carboxylate deaminase
MYVPMLSSSGFQLLSTRQKWQQLTHSLLQQYQIELWICQLETTIPEVSGNKCLKLKYHLLQAQATGKKGIFTFGGAFSNHLCAVAASCHHIGMQSLAYVRTDALDSNNPTLMFCKQMGMQLVALDRQEYRRRSESEFIQHLQQLHPQLFFVAEGGSSVAGAQGVAELDLASTPGGKTDMLVCAAASGGTLAGMINRHNVPVLGIAVVKDSTLPARVQHLLTDDKRNTQWQINTDFVTGGYGRFDPQLLEFCRDMARHQLYVEPIYTGKAMAGLFSLIAQGTLTKGSRLSFFHTGGLQGLNGLYYRGLITAADLALLSGSKAG